MVDTVVEDGVDVYYPTAVKDLDRYSGCSIMVRVGITCDKRRDLMIEQRNDVTVNVMWIKFHAQLSSHLSSV